MELGLGGALCAVTGASQGIGLATARLLAQEGARVILIARDADRLEEARAACGEQATALALDVTAADAPQRLLDACGGRVDALVNNAGTSQARPLDELTDADWQAQWDLHVMAPMRLMRAIAPVMAAGGGGRIVNVCSSAGKRPSLTNVAYSVTKAAQLSLSRAFADSFAARGVLINAVAPGAVATPLWMAPGGLADQTAAARSISREEAIEAQHARIPLGRFATEDEIGNVIAFLCSERASNVAGAAWSVDGGTVPVII